MLALVECLRDLLGRNESHHRPTLVLSGDMLELALASDNVAAMVFERFVELTMVGPDRLFHHLLRTRQSRPSPVGGRAGEALRAVHQRERTRLVHRPHGARQQWPLRLDRRRRRR